MILSNYFLHFIFYSIAVLVAQEKDYFRDPEILKGWFDLKVRNLEKKKYSVVVVRIVKWQLFYYV